MTASLNSTEHVVLSIFFNLTAHLVLTTIFLLKLAATEQSCQFITGWSTHDLFDDWWESHSDVKHPTSTPPAQRQVGGVLHFLGILVLTYLFYLLRLPSWVLVTSWRIASRSMALAIILEPFLMLQYFYLWRKLHIWHCVNQSWQLDCYLTWSQSVVMT